MRANFVVALIGFLMLVITEFWCGTAQALSWWQRSDREQYVVEPLPAGFRVINSELEGPVFADAQGRTLYKWPLRQLRNGDTGDRKGFPSTCTGEVVTVNAGMMSPYPPGLLLPDAATRRSCQQVWPPLLANKRAKPIGKWTTVARADGSTQWAYDGWPLYTSLLDQRPGDVIGGTKWEPKEDAPAERVAVGPVSNMPTAFRLANVHTGRMVVNEKGYSVYTSDADGPDQSNCTSECQKKWLPIRAGRMSVSHGGWSVIERSPGVLQWAFRKKPVYTYLADDSPKSFRGSDEPGWHNVYLQKAPPWPKEFVEHNTHAGTVLADSKGKTIYIYHCGDDAVDQQACDHPTTPQEYRIAVCGAGDPARCLKNWPPVEAPRNAKSPSRSWTAIDIDPNSGHLATAAQRDALHVWAFRGRPVYTFANETPGEVQGDAWGEFYGLRNGYKAFWLRNEFFSRD